MTLVPRLSVDWGPEQKDSGAQVRALDQEKAELRRRLRSQRRAVRRLRRELRVAQRFSIALVIALAVALWHDPEGLLALLHIGRSLLKDLARAV